jgi:hypothetical protein
MRVENQTETPVWEDSRFCPETSKKKVKIPFKNSTSGPISANSYLVNKPKDTGVIFIN